MICLVTGGAGFIGSHLADRLVAEGHRVIIVDNLSFNTTENICHHFENSLVSFVERDVCENLDDIFLRRKLTLFFTLLQCTAYRTQLSIPEKHTTRT